MSSLYLLLRYAMRVNARFRLPDGEVITGRFTGDEVLANVTGRQAAGRDGSGDHAETRNLAGIISKEQIALAQAD